MRCKALFLLTGVLLLITLGLHASSPSPLLTSLNNEFLHQSFAIKRKVGRFVIVEAANSTTVHRLVDTEVDANGGVQYLMRAGAAESLSLAPSQHVAESALSAAFDPGTQLWVQKIELKDDRIEFQLSSSPTNTTIASYAKLKFMLGRGYTSEDYKKIESLISDWLRIEKLEKKAQLQRNYAELKQQLDAAQAQQGANADPGLESKISSDQRLAQLYEQLASNRQQYAAMGESDTASADFNQQAQALRAEIAQLQEKRNAERRTELLGAESSEKVQYLALRQRLTSGRVGNQAQLQKRRSDIEAARKALGDLKSNYAQQQALGAGLPGSDLSWLEAEKRVLDSLDADIPNLQAKLNLGEIEAQYREMEQKRNELQAAYMKASGTPAQAAAAQALRRQLQVMYDNRVAAQGAGSKSAKQQAAGLQMVMQHLN